MSEGMTVGLVCDALQMALWKRKMPKDVIVHSDRGSQYCSTLYQSLLTQHELKCSMSTKGSCYDNACAESFFHSLKVGVIHGEQFKTRNAMRRQVFEYVELDYNKQQTTNNSGTVHWDDQPRGLRSPNDRLDQYPLLLGKIKRRVS